MRDFLKGLWRLSALFAAALLPCGLLLIPVGAWNNLGEAEKTVAPTATSTEAVALPSVACVVSEQTPPVAAVAASVPPKSKGGGTVVEEQVGGGVKLADNLYYKNRDGLNVDFSAFLNKKPRTVLEKSDEPQVLILHTHTTEMYMKYYAGYYNADDLGRSTDCTENVAVAGEALANRLRANGIGVIHDTTLHDDPQYTGAYYRSADTAEAIRKKYPSIKIVIDLHRDAVQQSDTVMVKPTVTCGGESYAQMMLVIGGEDTADNPNPNRDENVKMALALQQELQAAVPGIMRPIGFCACEYNQSLCPGFLVEVGAQANTFAEAQRSAALLGDAITAILGNN